MTTPNACFAYYVPDPGTAADWYRDHLEFQIHGDHRDAGPVRYVTASPPGATWQIVFSEVSTHGEGELADRFRAELGFAPHYMLIVEDVDAFVERARERGVEVAGEPAEGPFGRWAFVRDLHGDTITIASPGGWAALRR